MLQSLPWRFPLGTNALKIYRRHALHCPRYPGLKNKPDTFSKKEEKADVCQCPIWCRGYLAKEIKFVRGKQRLKRVIASLDTNSLSAAEQEVARLYERGALPTPASGFQAADRQAVTVRYAAGRYLESRRDGSLNPIEEDTYNHYASLLNQRLIPFCDERGIVYIRDFENKDLCCSSPNRGGNCGAVKARCWR